MVSIGALLSIFLQSRNTNAARWYRLSIANAQVPEYRYEKEFDQVQDVFELQVRFCLSPRHILQYFTPSCRLLIIVRWSTEKFEQRFRIRSRPFALCPHCCVESCEKSQ